MKGGNGTGKSSIVEAIEFLITGRIRHLGTPDVGLKFANPYGSAVAHSLHGKKDMLVEGVFDPGDFLVRRTINLVSGLPEQLQQFPTGNFLLRRAEVLNFVNSTSPQRIPLLSEMMNAEKAATITGVYESVGKIVQKYVRKLNPGMEAPMQNIRLLMVSDGAKVAMDWPGVVGVEPRRYASEGNLDLLGVCIFLAFVKELGEPCPFLILDDVVTTIDAEHRQELVELLFEEFGDKQLIITTHDQIWFEQLKNLERVYHLENNFKNMEIVGWDINSGPKIRLRSSELGTFQEGIERNLSEGDTRAAANEVRQYLESVLSTACNNLQVPVRYREDGRYEVGYLFDPLYSMMVSKTKLEQNGKKRFSEAFEDVRKTRIFGNLLSHSNPFAQNLSLAEVRSFFDAVKNLHRVLLCPSCQGFLEYTDKPPSIRCTRNSCPNPIVLTAKV